MKKSISLILALVLCLSLCACGIASTQTETDGPTEPVEHKIYKDCATNAALEIFHAKVKLKNESSFVLNDSKVTAENKPYQDLDYVRKVTVVLDYSAENGFGGMNRDTYTVEMLFNLNTGGYHRLDGTFISTGK